MTRENVLIGILLSLTTGDCLLYLYPILVSLSLVRKLFYVTTFLRGIFFYVLRNVMYKKEQSLKKLQELLSLLATVAVTHTQLYKKGLWRKLIQMSSNIQEEIQ